MYTVHSEYFLEEKKGKCSRQFHKIPVIFALCTLSNPLWPSDAIWRHRSGSSLAQVMACSLATTSHYLNQRWLITKVFCGFYPRAISQKMLMNLIRNMCSEITLLNFLPHPPGELTLLWWNLGREKSNGGLVHGANLWWRHQMETFSALLSVCVGNSPVAGELPTQRPVTQSFDVFSSE